MKHLWIVLHLWEKNNGIYLLRKFNHCCKMKNALFLENLRSSKFYNSLKKKYRFATKNLKILTVRKKKNRSNQNWSKNNDQNNKEMEIMFTHKITAEWSNLYINRAIKLEIFSTIIKTRRTNDKDKEENTIMKIFQSKEGRMKEPPRKTIEEAET